MSSRYRSGYPVVTSSGASVKSRILATEDKERRHRMTATVNGTARTTQVDRRAFRRAADIKSRIGMFDKDASGTAARRTSSSSSVERKSSDVAAEKPPSPDSSTAPVNGDVFRSNGELETSKAEEESPASGKSSTAGGEPADDVTPADDVSVDECKLVRDEAHVVVDEPATNGIEPGDQTPNGSESDGEMSSCEKPDLTPAEEKRAVDGTDDANRDKIAEADEIDDAADEIVAEQRCDDDVASSLNGDERDTSIVDSSASQSPRVASPQLAVAGPPDDVVTLVAGEVTTCAVGDTVAIEVRAGVAADVAPAVSDEEDEASPDVAAQHPPPPTEPSAINDITLTEDGNVGDSVPCDKSEENIIGDVNSEADDVAPAATIEPIEPAATSTPLVAASSDDRDVDDGATTSNDRADDVFEHGEKSPRDEDIVATQLDDDAKEAAPETSEESGVEVTAAESEECGVVIAAETTGGLGVATTDVEHDAEMRNVAVTSSAADKSVEELPVTSDSVEDPVCSASNDTEEQAIIAAPTMVHSIENLDEIKEERVLEKMLMLADSYDDRKKIRAAMRKLRTLQRDNVATARQSKTRADAKTSLSSSKPSDTTAINRQTNITPTHKQSKSASALPRSTSTTDLPPSPLTPQSSPSTIKGRTERLTSTDCKLLAEKYDYKQTVPNESTRKMDKTPTAAGRKVGSIFDREEESPRKSGGRSDADRRRDLQRNRSMPASSNSKDARKMFVAKLESNVDGTKTKKSVGRSPTFVVPNAQNIKQMLLKWCQAKTRGYEHVDITNFSGSWASGMAFCALVHKFFPEAFDYSQLDPKNRAQNFSTAFEAAEEQAEIAQLLDAEDMVRMAEPDWKCVYTYIVEFYKRIRELGLT